MSKLFDQLKDAARDREGGLLMGALAKKQAEEAAAAAAVASAARPVEALASPVEPTRPSVAASPVTAQVDPTPRAPGSSLGGIALAAAIFGIAVLAWHSTPWRAPQKMKIDPESLKLDRSLILDRPSELGRDPSKGTTSPSRPS